jgi:hypothetical protein
MVPQVFDATPSADEIVEAAIESLSATGLMQSGMSLEECECLSDSEFRMLVTLVVIATGAFGCIVNGWLI